MELPMAECERILGERFYGFGRWNAPYWFIGPEQGQAKGENNDLALRCTAFIGLERDGLCDCREFHERVGVRDATKWYRPARNGEVPLQPTWCRLMKILFAYKSDEVPSGTQLKKYQTEHLGRDTGETCVVELSGVPANNMKVERDRTSYLDARLNRFVEEIEAKQPDFVMIYRKKDYWSTWETKLRQRGGHVGADGIWRLGKSRIGFTLMPLAQSDAELIRLGRKLRAN